MTMIFGHWLNENNEKQNAIDAVTHDTDMLESFL